MTSLKQNLRKLRFQSVNVLKLVDKGRFFLHLLVKLPNYRNKFSELRPNHNKVLLMVICDEWVELLLTKHQTRLTVHSHSSSSLARSLGTCWAMIRCSSSTLIRTCLVVSGLARTTLNTIVSRSDH